MITSNKPRPDKSKQAARDLETDNDEKRLDKTLGKIAKALEPKEIEKRD